MVWGFVVHTVLGGRPTKGLEPGRWRHGAGGWRTWWDSSRGTAQCSVSVWRGRQWELSSLTMVLTRDVCGCGLALVVLEAGSGGFEVVFFLQRFFFFPRPISVCFWSLCRGAFNRETAIGDYL